MKTLKTAFTLAEVLITLGIIGVIATMTVPQLMLKTRDVQAGAVLGKAVQQIELGAKNYLQAKNEAEDNDGSYYTSLKAINYKAQDMALYAGADFVEESPDITIKKYGGDVFTTSEGLTSYNRFRFSKLNAEYIAYSDTNLTGTNSLGYVTYLIDINGFDTSPNSYGKDIFEFNLYDSGKMKPYGLTTSDNYESNCTNSNIKDGRACAARVVADGFKITY